MKSYLFSALFGCALAIAAPLSAQEAGGSTFSTVIKPILESKCISCHGAEKQDAHLRLDTKEAALKAGDTGYPAIIPGNATFSNLVKRITLAPDHVDVMPPKDSGCMTAEEIVAIIHWVNRGAEWDEGLTLVSTAAPAAAPAPAPTPAPEAAPVTPAAAPGGVDFASQVLPILESRCFECHGAEKQKGDLRLDTKEAILKGGEHGPVLVASNAAESSLYKLTILPADHADIMPAKGDPLSKEQTDLLANWINAGAAFGDWTQVAAKQPEAANLLEVLAQNTQPAAEEKLAKLQEQGAVAMQLGQTSPLVRVDFQLAGEQVTDAQLASLAELADQLTWLNLANTKITDAGLASLAPLKKLTSLHLEKTAVTDAGLAHLASLENLQYLNLYGTTVSDAGLEQLKGLKNLQRLYLWQTQVTQQGADGLKQALPGVEINLGADLATVVPPPAAPATPETPAAPAAAPAEVPKVVPAIFFDAEGCCAKGAAAGADCAHPCCVEARAKNEVCGKCNPAGVKKQALAALFVKDACCAKALAEGKECDHPCCAEARAKGELCAKCNPGAAAPAAAPATEASAEQLAQFDVDGCCGKAKAAGQACTHPCCVEALAKASFCFKCNPNTGKATAQAKGLKLDGCCFEALAAAKACEHPCCKEAATAAKVCEKCNPKAA